MLEPSLGWALIACGLTVGAPAAVLATLSMSVRYRLGTPGRASDPAFQAILAGLTNSACLPVSAVSLTSDVDAIYGEMLAAIETARLSVTMETYLFWTGAVADRFAAALAGRAAAGVAVKLLIDSEGCRNLDLALVEDLRRAGCEVRFFRRFSWRQPLRYNHRTHRKLLVVDGHTAFTGGIGVADIWLGPPRWFELGLRLEGPAVALIQGAFFRHWALAGGVLEMAPTYFPPSADDAAGRRPNAMVTASSPAWGDSPIALLMYAAIAAAERRLCLVSPYFLPDRALIGALRSAAARGVEVRLLLPGPRNDNPFAYFASRRLYRPLLAAGVRIYEYQPAMMHAKAMVVDGRLAIVGSANFDPRSFFLNSELNVTVDDPALAAALEVVVGRAIAASQAIEAGDRAGDRFYAKLAGILGLALRDQL